MHPGLVSLEGINAQVNLLKREDQGEAFLKIMRYFGKVPISENGVIGLSRT